ncbi:MAG: lipoyl(octanoyl) transferase LipB [Gemmatimonadetes bacterium]|nr:lipoyl(octanoyl) transferase LipB [Gemmatimonadota bacterium]
MLQLQRRIASERRSTPEDHDVLLLVEHDPVVTLGRGSDGTHLVASEETLRARGIEVVGIERGGDVTYHGPGQLVGYPILDLNAYERDLHWYLRRLEEILLRVLADVKLPGYRVEGYTGVWTTGSSVGPGLARLARAPRSRAGTPIEADGFPTVPETLARGLISSGELRKIASIGVHASRWITRHGFALNVTAETLANFRWIVPCGITGVRMTSLASEGAQITMSDARHAVLQGFDAAFPTARTAREVSTR